MTTDGQRLERAIRATAIADGVTPTAVPGVDCVRFVATESLQNRRWRACLAIVAEGTKELVLGDNIYAVSRGHYTVTPVPLPLTSRIAEAPFSGLLVSLDPAVLGRVVADMDARDEEAGELRPGIFIGELDPSMHRAVAGLVELFDEEETGRVLGEGRIRELLFHLLRGPNGPAIRRFVRAGSVEHRIYAVTHRIEAQLNSPIDVDVLAATAQVSRTVFYEQFKRVTSFSPLQYQKRLRLLQAQRLMVDEHTTAEDAAYRVGYQSPSQFSRDYARLFGEPPGRNTTRLRDDVAAK